MLTPGEIHSLHVEKPAAGGAMIARADGQVVMVTGAIPGEQVRVRIDRVAKGVAHGSVVEVEQSSADRRDPFVDPACGGCLYAHIEYARQLAIKSEVIADAFARIGRMPLTTPVIAQPSPVEGYRMRARLHLRRGRLGFFREGSHDLCDARATHQLLPESMESVETLADVLRAAGVTAAEMDVSENVAGTERAVWVETSPDAPPVALRSLPSGLSGVTIATRGDRSDLGRHRIADAFTIDGRTFRFERHVLAFFQGNRFLLARFVEHVLECCRGAKTAFDLYAGVGLFSVPLASAGVRVVAVEGDKVAAEDLRMNAREVAGLETVHQPVERFVGRAHAAPEVVLVDPPRTGLSREAVQGVGQLRPAKVVYVSCDVATLARDARALAEAGYRLTRIEAFDLFPNTPHIETVAAFQR